MAKAKAKVRAGHKIIDIAKPNDSAPSATSKSVIIKHQPMMRDPMMAAPKLEAEVKAVPDAAAEPASVRHEKMIIPDAAKPVAKTIAQPTNQPVAPATLNPPAPVATDIKPVESFTVSESIPAEDTPGYASDKSPKAADADAETEAETRRKTLDDLVQKQTYFLPINSSGQQKKKQFITAGVLLAIVLAAAWLNIALDAELIQISGIEAPTDFFSN